MIVLVNTVDNIQIVLAASATTNQLNCITSYRDLTSSTFVAGRTVANTNNVTAVNIVPAPPLSTKRVVDFISVYNCDTVSAKVTINYYANGNIYKLWQGVLAVGEKVEFSKDGFIAIDSSGSVKSEIDNSPNPVTTPLSNVTLTSDVINADSVANTLYPISGLSFNVNSGHTYYFKFIIPYASVASSTGSRWTITGVTTTRLNYTSRYNSSNVGTSQQINFENAYGLPSTDTLSSSINGNVATIEGILKASANGSITPMFASEVASSAITAKAGAICQYLQIA